MGPEGSLPCSQNLPLVPILSQTNPVHSTMSYLRSIFILSCHLSLGLPSGLSPSGFPTKILYAFLGIMCNEATITSCNEVNITYVKKLL
jgi:hypothetical protein